MRTLDSWLRGIGLERYLSLFEDNGVDLRALSLLGESDFEKLGVLLGHRKILLKAIAELEPEPLTRPSPRDSTLPPGPPSTDGERRQLTVMFCDLVGSTALSERLDPEELRDVVQAYQTAASQVVARFDGHVAQHLGDGLLIYFGHPVAHEDDGERAIRAGLGIIEAMRALSPRVVESHQARLSVRIGIHSGLVVVSDVGAGARQERLALGDTPNVAARLQGLAEPDTLVVSDRSRQLAGGSFSYDDLGEHSLKGVAQPIRVHRVTGFSGVATRFEAAAKGELTPMVDREHEVRVLLERWRRAQRGEGQVTLISGEAGVGKSRILSELLEKLDVDESVTLRLQCSPYHTESAFYPCIDYFERAMNFGRDESAQAKLDKLEALLVGRYGSPPEDVRLIAPVLSIPCQERYGPLALPPQQLKQETIRALVRVVEGATRHRPGVVVFEDAHWADSATLEMLERLVACAGGLLLLIVVTCRPEFEPAWTEHTHSSVVELSRLSRADSSAIASSVSAEAALPEDLLEQIVVKADGVPLFIEELTRSILEAGSLTGEGNQPSRAGALAGVPIPATLRDSLMARLDRVSQVKEIAQVGAAIGREFGHEILEALVGMPRGVLDEALERLIDTGLAFRRRNGDEFVYVFKHALVQDAAYDSMLKSRRRQLHREIALWYERVHGHDLSRYWSLLARHWELSGDTLRAVDYLEREVLRTFSMGLAKQSVDVGLHAAELLNLKLPTEPTAVKAQIAEQMAEVMARLSGRAPAELIELPEMQDATVARSLSLLLRVAPFAFQSHQIELFALIAVSCLRVTLQYGKSPHAADVYSMYSVVHRGLTGDRVAACAWSRLALDQDRAFGGTMRAKVVMVHGWFHSHWVHPLSASLPLALDGAEAGLATGDIVFGLSNLAVYVVCLGALGRPLGEVIEIARANIERNGKRVMNSAYHLIHELQVAKALAGLTRSPLSMSDDEYDEDRDLAFICQTEFANQIGYYLASRVKLHAHFGDWPGALEWAARARALEAAFEGQLAEVDLVFFEGIAALSAAAEPNAVSAAKWLEQGSLCERTLQSWSRMAPQNFAHKAALLAAMVESVSGDPESAASHYARAAKLAEEAGHLPDAALAREHEARFHRSRGNEAAAHQALGAALAGYRAWGAEAKVRYLS